MSSYFSQFVFTLPNMKPSFFTLFNEVSLLLILIVFQFFLLVLVKNYNLVSSGSFFVFMMNMFLHFFSMMKEMVDNKKELLYYSLWVSVLFICILILNVLGFFMYMFPLTSHFFISFTLSFSIWISLMFFGFYLYGLDYSSIFFPGGSPLMMAPLLVFMEMVSSISSPLALGLSLGANMTAGHMLLSMMSNFMVSMFLNSSLMIFYLSFFSVLILFLLLLLELVVLFIQAYVFSLLTTIYLKESLHLH